MESQKSDIVKPQQKEISVEESNNQTQVKLLDPKDNQQQTLDRNTPKKSENAENASKALENSCNDEGAKAIIISPIDITADPSLMEQLDWLRIEVDVDGRDIIANLRLIRSDSMDEPTVEVDEDDETDRCFPIVEPFSRPRHERRLSLAGAHEEVL